MSSLPKIGQNIFGNFVHLVIKAFRDYYSEEIRKPAPKTRHGLHPKGNIGSLRIRLSHVRIPILFGSSQSRPFSQPLGQSVCPVG